MRLRLPALLQGFDCINPQHRHGAQLLGFFNHGLTGSQALGLHSLQRSCSLGKSGLPQGLQLCKHFFTHVPGITPAVGELMQDAVKALPVIVQGGAVGRRPAFDFFNQGQTLGTVFGRFGLDLLQPAFHHFVGFVAGFIKAFPQCVVGHAALVGLLPLVAQGAQGFLHLAPTDGLAFGTLEQALGLAHQLFADLVGTPALPTFELAGGCQCGMGLVLELGINQLAEFLERIAQGTCSAGAGLAMALAYFLFYRGQCGFDGSIGAGAQLGVHLGLGHFGLGHEGNTAGYADFIRPNGDGWQRCRSILGCSHSHGECRLKGIPHHQELAFGSIQQGREFDIYAHPVGVGHQSVGLTLPVLHIGAQGVQCGLCIGQRLGGQHFYALGEQYRCLALYLYLMLEVFNSPHSLGELGLECQQRLFAQRCTGFGRVTLPSQCIRNIQFARVNQGLRLGCPLSA